MPNHVTNIIRVTKGLDKFREVLVNEETDTIDFNKLIPMPKELSEIDEGAYTWGETLLTEDKEVKGRIAQFLDSIYTDSITFDDFLELAIKKISTDDLAIVEKYFIEKTSDLPHVTKNIFGSWFNLRRYGHATWYRWSIDNWGTKWNAYDQEKLLDETYQFDTAWGSPFAIFNALADVGGIEFIVGYADEDIGSNYGFIEYTEENGFAESTDCLNGVAFGLMIKQYYTDVDSYFKECELTEEEIESYYGGRPTKKDIQVAREFYEDLAKKL